MKVSESYREYRSFIVRMDGETLGLETDVIRRSSGFYVISDVI